MPSSPSDLVIPVYDDSALGLVEDNHAREITRETNRERPPRPARPPEGDQSRPQFARHPDQPTYPDVPVFSFGYDYPRPSVVKNYTVNLSNPLTANSLEVVNAIYQDFLLPSVVGLKFSTLKSRDGIYQVVRNLVIGGVDGQEIHLASTKFHSLMSQLKLLEASSNPQRHQTDDPYRFNPFDTIIMRCGYPIRYQDSGQVSLARENISLNLRLYRLDQAEYAFKTLSFFSALELNPWREMLFYQMLNQSILKTKESPHFPMLYGYLLCKSQIRFDTFNRNRGENDKLSRYRQDKLRKYAVKLAHNQRTLGVSDGATIVNGVLSGGGVVFIDPQGRILLRRIPHGDGRHQVAVGPLERLPTGGLGRTENSENQMIARAAMKAFGYHVRVTADILHTAISYNIPVDGSYSYKVFVIPVESLSIDNMSDMIMIELDRIYDTSSLFDVRTQKILREIKSQGWPSRVAGLSPYPLNRIKPDINRSICPDECVTRTFRASPLSPEGLASPSGKALVLATESPTHNILQWCSKGYTSGRSLVRKMTRLGIYQDDVWLNVIFQIMHGAMAMLRHGLAFRNMSLAKNVYIKDLPALSNQYWTYDIEGVRYWLPHAGYLVMLDIGGVEEDDFGSKVLCKEWGDTDVTKVLITGLRNMLDHSSFSPTSLPPNANPPSAGVLAVLDGISKGLDPDVDESQSVQHVHTVLMDNLPHFFHPRIGTRLSDQEINLLTQKTPRTSEITRGQIVALSSVDPSVFTWVYVVSKSDRPNSGVVNIVYRDPVTRATVRESVSRGLIRLSRSPKPIDIFSQECAATNFSYETCLEHYRLS